MVLAVIVVYLVQLFSLQIVEYDKYLTIAGNNALLKKITISARGLLYDRNGELLVYNRAAYDVMITMNEVQPFDTLDFCESVNITPEYLKKRLTEIKNQRGYSRYTPQVLITQLSEKENGILQEKLYKFPGFELRNHTLREYKYPYAGHLLGSMGEVSQEQIDKDSYYSLGDYAGQSGVELSYEKLLRGEKGMNLLMRDSKGRIKGKYENGEYDTHPISGENLTLTIDIFLQEYGEKLLSGKLGAIVAIEPATGEILALVSNPTFNPAMLVGRKRSDNYKILERDPLKPLLNRATKGRYSPGSTFKPLQALVCLQDDGINLNSYFPCNGQASSPIRCTHSHGSPVSLLSAVEQSCNPYFWQAFRSTLERDGYGKDNKIFKKNYNKWRENVISFGYGKKFDNDIVEQEQDMGNIPSVEYFSQSPYKNGRRTGGFGETGWRALTIRSLAIGQGEIAATPLQMANLVATIANRGYFYTPHVARTGNYSKKKNNTNVEAQYFEPIVEGMWRVCESGTAKYYKIKDLAMCGKTGTVQNNQGKDHSLFIGFAPENEPEIAIAVVIENAGYGATWAYPIASLMIEKYLNSEIAKNRLWLEEKILNTNFINN